MRLPTHSSLTRRKLLRSLGWGAAALPLLSEMGRARAAGAHPKRLVIVTFPNGVHGSAFWPKADAQGLLIDEGPQSSMAPLKPFAKKLLVVGGLALANMYDADARWSHSSTPFVLTAAPGAPFEGAWDGMKKTGGAPSLDLHVAAGLAAKGVKTPFPSLSLRSGTYKGNDGYLSIAGPPIANKVNAPAPETEPARLFQNLFGGAASNDEQLAALARERQVNRSVLDFISGGFPELKSRVGAANARKVEAHWQAVRDLELRLAKEPVKSACTRGEAPDAASSGEVRYLGRIGRQFSELTVAALRCDLTRVVNIGWTGASYQFTFPQSGGARVLDADTTGPYKDEHGIAHDVSHGAEALRQKILVDRWFMSEFAHLLKLMDEEKEGDGTLLDHSIVLLTNQMADGYWHSASDMPYVIAGGGNGAVRTNRLVRYAGGSANKMWKPHAGLLQDISLAMDVPAEGLQAGPYGGPHGTLT